MPLDHPDLVNSKVVLATQAVSVEEPLWDELKDISCPVLILIGNEKSAQPQPVLTDDDIDKYYEKRANQKEEIIR